MFGGREGSTQRRRDEAPEIADIFAEFVGVEDLSGRGAPCGGDLVEESRAGGDHDGHGARRVGRTRRKEKREVEDEVRRKLPVGWILFSYVARGGRRRTTST